MNTIRRFSAIALIGAGLAGCGSVDCMSVPSYKVGNIQYYRTIDPAGCAASRAMNEISAYDESLAKAQASSGSAYQKYLLGSTYETGGSYSINEPDGRWRGSSAALGKNRRQAIYWYKQAVLQGGSGAEDARNALLRLGKKPPEISAEQLSSLGYEAYEKGDDAKAIAYWREAAQKGDVHAQHNLGWAHHNGRGAPQNYPEAVHWYRLAADQGHVSAQSTLGDLFLFGAPGVEVDRAEAARFFRMAAEQGDLLSQKNLGLMYKQGGVVQQSDAAAVRWFRQAAEKGYAPAQYSLGLMYEEGRGVPKNIVTAIDWYRKAAANGDNEAQQSLERLGASS